MKSNYISIMYKIDKSIYLSLKCTELRCKKKSAGSTHCLLINQELIMSEKRDKIIVHRGHIQQTKKWASNTLISFPGIDFILGANKWRSWTGLRGLDGWSCGRNSSGRSSHGRCCLCSTQYWANTSSIKVSPKLFLRLPSESAMRR